MIYVKNCYDTNDTNVFFKSGEKIGVFYHVIHIFFNNISRKISNAKIAQVDLLKLSRS